MGHQLERQIAHGEETAAGDYIALDACEPYLDLVKPRRVGGSEMESDTRVLLEESCDLFLLWAERRGPGTGQIGSIRSNAFFSSTQKTPACCGGSR